MKNISKSTATVDLEKNISREYNGKETLMLNPGEKFVFQFQVRRAEMILKNLPLIKAFVEKYGK